MSWPTPRPGSRPAPREVQVLWWLAHGLGYRGAARRVGIAEGTLKSHLHRLYARLQCRDTAHAVAICHRMGLFPPGDRTVLTVQEQAEASGHG